MSMDERKHRQTDEQWFLLRHHNPELIDRQLQEVNAGRVNAGQRALLYLVPYQYIQRAGKGGECDESIRRQNTLRNDFRRFVFVKGTRDEIDALLQEDWNVRTQLRLHYCRSYFGEPLRASSSDMDRLMKVFIDCHERYHLVPVDPDFKLNERVRMRTGIFAEQEVQLVKINYTAKGINLTLAVPLFNGGYTLEMKGRGVMDIEVPERMQKFLSPDLMTVIEQDLIDILRRRVMKKKQPPETREELTAEAVADADKLNTYYILNYMEFADRADQNHFRALMLLCASLRRDEAAVESLIPVVKALVDSELEATNDEEAFLLAILFVATHDIIYRTAVKLYEQTHTVTYDSLARLLPVVKRIRVRNNERKRKREA